jgi:hypothetical protein
VALAASTNITEFLVVTNALAYFHLTVTLTSFINIAVGLKFLPITNALAYFGPTVTLSSSVNIVAF